MPKLHRHFKKCEFDPKLVVFQWFVCLLASYMDFDMSIKVFDLILLEGVPILFSVGLAIFETMQKHLLTLNDFGEIFEACSRIPKEILNPRKLFILE